MKTLFQKIVSSLEKGTDCVLMMITGDGGYVPRGCSAKMMVARDGSQVGTIGGGDLEARALKLAQHVLKTKSLYSPALLLDNTSLIDLDMLPAGHAQVNFLYLSAQDEATINLFKYGRSLINQNHDSWLILEYEPEKPFQISFYSRSAGILGKHSPYISEHLSSMTIAKPVYIVDGDKFYYAEPIARKGQVYIFGGGHVTKQLVPLLSLTEFRTIVVDNSEDYSSSSLYPLATRTMVSDFANAIDTLHISPRDYILIMTRSPMYDYSLIRQALKTPAKYIGMLGNTNKAEIFNRQLFDDGFDRNDIKRILCPMGLPIGSTTPEEIAISITAQLIKFKAEYKQ